jgi:carbon-monoxide dehydrogenase medium subunit
MIAAYHQPEALQDALAHVARGATPIAGATGLFTGRPKREGELVDLSRVGLDTVQVSDSSITLGAAVTLAQIGKDTSLPGMAGAVLRRAARSVASAPLRNAITLGGNIAHLVYWADMPVALLALDASLQVQSVGQPVKEVSIVEALAQGKKAWDGGLILGVRIPLRAGKLGFGYVRFTRTVTDYALASACVTLRLEGGVARDVRVALGAVQSRPGRVAQVEATVEGTAVDAAVLSAVKAKMAAVVQVGPNFRAPADFRRTLATVLTARAVETAWTWGSREDG